MYNVGLRRKNKNPKQVLCKKFRLFYCKVHGKSYLCTAKVERFGLIATTYKKC